MLISKEEKKQYRPNVGLMIINKKGQVWVGARADKNELHSISGKYYYEQMPQGGIDIDETPLEAAYRELKEETGLTKDKVQLLCQSKEWYAYQFPKPVMFSQRKYIGQCQKWFLFLYEGMGEDFNLRTHPEEIEFISYQWYEPDVMMKKVVPFKRDVYACVIKEFLPMIQEIIQKYK